MKRLMMKANEKVVIRIVDDDPAIHDSLGLIFDMAGMIVRHYYSGEEFLAADFLNDAGCAVVDLRMGGMSGLELQQKLKSAGCGLPLIFLSGHGDIETAVSAMEEGAVTFLTKTVTADKVMEAVGRALEGRRREADGVYALQERLETLSSRERQILDLLCAGLSCRAVADRLVISLRTAECHRTSVMRKLHCAGLKEFEALLPKLSK
ncbi:MAG: response regulator [Sutterella wadsworthensis]|nr:response regulator [Sutterella wadsworthensis]